MNTDFNVINVCMTKIAKNTPQIVMAGGLADTGYCLIKVSG